MLFRALYGNLPVERKRKRIPGRIHIEHRFTDERAFEINVGFSLQQVKLAPIGNLCHQKGIFIDFRSTPVDIRDRQFIAAYLCHNRLIVR